VPEDAFGLLVAALARGDLTSAQLEQRLLKAGFGAGACAEALGRAADAGYLDDTRVAVERARRLGERNASDEAIRADLAGRGVPEKQIELALAQVTPEVARAERLATRLGGGARAARALLRKGYPEDVVERTLRLEIAE
jgi:SOS response regulatory protein OraA/RecX